MCHIALIHPVLWVQCKISFTFNIYSLQLWWENSWESCLIWYVNEFYCTVTAAYKREHAVVYFHIHALLTLRGKHSHTTLTLLFLTHPPLSIHPSIWKRIPFICSVRLQARLILIQVKEGRTFAICQCEVMHEVLAKVNKPEKQVCYSSSQLLWRSFRNIL